MTTALVTGSAGFLGRHFTAELKSHGYSVWGYDIADGDDFLTKIDDYLPWERMDLVVHCAAVSPNRLGIDTKPHSLLQNQLLDAAMFEWAVRTRQKRVLYISSCAALDFHPDDYGLLKQTGERLAAQARRAGVPVTVVRPYSGYGEDQSEDFPFRAIIERARRRDDPFDIWGDGTQQRDWIHVDDLVKGALAVVESGTTDPISLCTGFSNSMLSLAKMAAGEVGYEPTYNFRTDMPSGPSRRVGNPERLHEFYTPKISLQEGVRRALA